ncbi:MAG: signal peptidase II [Kofleriaceae bacterium]|nr:signal peptidase II [Kofleriaceae bacterium]MCL4228849.1 signal peptidase II [Myxococcales bacterium]
MPRRWKLFLLVAMFTMIADQATKLWARDALPVHPAGCEIPDAVVAGTCIGLNEPVIDGYWDWRLSFNQGSAFGLFHGQTGARVFLSIVGVLALGVMVWMVKRARDDQKWLLWALGLVAGGAVGNLIDRIYFGVVTDFVLWHTPAKEAKSMYRYAHEWPVFNVADVALVVGVVIMLFASGDDGKERKADKADKADKAGAAAKKSSPAA